MIKNKKINNLIILSISLSFFLFFCFYDGVVWCDDSLSYVENLGFREPLYPLLIKICRILFDENIYLQVVVFIQSLLMGLVTYSLVKYINEEFEIHGFLEFLPLLMILGVSLLTRFVAGRSSMYSNSILSEGIAYPLFLLFFRYLLDFTINKENKKLIFSTILSFLLLSTRKQMLLSLFLIVVSLVYIMFCSKKFRESLLKIVLIFVLVIGGYKAFDFINIQINNGGNTGHTGDNRFIAAMVIYSSDREDASQIEDENLKELFLDIYDECNDNKYLKKYESGNFYEKFNHYSDNFDYVQIDVMWEKVKEYVSSKYGLSGYQRDEMVDEIDSIFISSLLPNVLPKVLDTVVNNFLSGLVIAISADRECFIIYSFLVYFLYLIIAIYLTKKEGFNKYSIFSLLVLISIVANNCIVSIGVFNQTRYTIYNLALFYIALFLNIYKCLQIRTK